ncbi:uncharacterized protein I303_106804 [Kwoniella dejecticola CBS 10117]|uniref:RNase III domain-containing protein n=1 Tax=Kwoniella dejecticola CBS 10117 TaxID=1296121 RepID=A0A1A5ZTM4_9TREE|nr:uncharacterized protein I303_08554 [Kwoniella dejecticola CBS 10117]OBR81169.1 hypothetical protein I303_08554 [Kwoniella dejecticola CBS 10117]
MAEKALASLSISSLPPGIDLPPLPIIQDGSIERRVFTHSSFIARPRHSIQLFELEDECRDNEKLELLGDSLLDSAVVGLLQDMYPNLSPGITTQLKSHLVNNSTLRELCKCYHLNERLIAPAEQLPVLRNGEKVLANLFEAYIAGVYYSYLKYGPGTSLVSTDTTSTISMPTPPRSPQFDLSSPSHTSTPIHNGNHVDRGRSPTRGEAMDYLEEWLRPLFQPIAQHILNQMKAEQSARHAESGGTTENQDTDHNARGANARLNQWFEHKEGGIPDYAQSKAGDAWKVLCIATDRHDKKWYGEATRATVKAAKAVAAYKVCAQFELERPEFKA